MKIILKLEKKTIMAKLTELIQKLPAATTDVAIERAKSFGKSISRNVQPKNILSKSFYALHSALSTESPALGTLFGGLAGLGSDIVSGAKSKSAAEPKEAFKKPKITAPDVIKETTSPMLGILESIDSSIKTILDIDSSISSEIKTFTDITSQSLDIDKKSLKATRKANDIQVGIEKTKRTNTLKKRVIAKDIETDLLADKKEIDAGKTLDEKMSKGMMDFFKSIISPGIGIGAGAYAGGSLTKNLLNLIKGKSTPTVGRDKFGRFTKLPSSKAETLTPTVGRDKFGRFTKLPSVKTAGAGVTEGLGTIKKPGISGKILSRFMTPALFLTIATGIISGAINSAMSTKLFNTKGLFGKIMDDFKTKYKNETLVDALIGFLLNKDIVSTITETMFGAGKGWAHASQKIAKGLFKGFISIIQGTVANIFALLGTMVPDTGIFKKLGIKKFLKNTATTISNAQDWAGDIGTSIESGAQGIANRIVGVPSTKENIKFTENVIPSKTTQKAISLNHNQREYDRASARMESMILPSSNQRDLNPILNNTRNIVNNATSNTFYGLEKSSRDSEMSKYLYGSVFQ